MILLSTLGRAAPPELRELLDRQVYDARGRRLARVGDVELEPDRDGHRVLAVQVGPGALVRRLGARRLAQRLDPGRIEWAALQPAHGHPGALQLRGGVKPRRHRHRFPVMHRRRRAPL